MLIVEQNAGVVLELADTAYLLETGSIVVSGTAAEIRDNEAIRAAYLGY
jgi:branched-chain amino acid transport system ATP-binding protein